MAGPAAAITAGVPSLENMSGQSKFESNPQTAESFSLPDLSDPTQLEPGGIPFETFEGKASIARASVNWRFRVPEESRRDSSVIIDHGLGAKQGAYSELADYLASHGIATADYRATHFQSWLAGMHPKHLFNASRLLYQAPWGVIRDIQSREDIEAPTDLFTMAGHSLGGRTAARNGSEHPDTIDNVIVIDGSCLENHSLPGLALRLPGFGRKELLPLLAGGDLSIDQKTKLVIGGITYFAENPWRGAGEIWSLSRDRIGDDMARLSEDGTGTAIIDSPQDTLVHTDEAEGEKADLFVALSELPGKKLDHLGPIRHPEVYGRTLISVLDYLDSIKDSENSRLQLAA